VSASDLVEAVTDLKPERVLVGRALDPALRADLAESIDYEELPFVRGRTVVPADLTPGDVVIAGHPNFLGIFDLPEAPQWIAVTGRWSGLASRSGAAKTVSMGDKVGRDVADPLLASAVDLAKQLAQLRGVRIPFLPECPVLIALLPVDPRSMGGEPLTDYAELPGGLRIELGSGVDPVQYAAALSQALDDLGEERQNRWMQPPAP
jgi:hypothetical protein